MFYQINLDNYMLNDDKQNFAGVLQKAWNAYTATQGRLASFVQILTLTHFTKNLQQTTMNIFCNIMENLYN